MPAPKPWAVLVYLVADDHRGSPSPSLDEIAERELDLMFAAVDRANMHLAVQVDFRNRQRVWRFLKRDPDHSLPESSAGDPQTIINFLNWAYATCRAERYLILFWGHAFGTAGLFPDASPEVPTSRDILSLKELSDVLAHANALSGGPVVDIIMFKNCCLSNVETAYQLRDEAEFMIASQTRMPAEGWPYDGMFDALTAERGTDTNTEQIARRLVRQLADYYAETLTSRDVPITLLRLDVTRRLTEPMRKLSAEIVRVQQSDVLGWGDVVPNALRRAARVGDPALPDVVNLCRYLRDPSAPYDRALTEAAQHVEHVISREMVLSHFSKTSAFNGTGVFYSPRDNASRQDSIVANAIDIPDYVRLSFNRVTNWHEVAFERGALDALTRNRRAAPTASSWR